MRRSFLRVLTLAALIAVAVILHALFEVRKTAYSCRTFWTCIGVGRSHAYAHHIPSAHVGEVIETLRDGTIRYERNVQGANAEILILTLIRDAASWSSDFRSTQRTAHDFVDVLISSKLDLTNMSLAVMTSSVDEFERLKIATARVPFCNVMILLQPDAESSIPYTSRHDPRVQLARRSMLAVLRNTLTSRALKDESHVIWLDADVTELSDSIVQKMLFHSLTNEKAGIITAACHQNQMDNYDKNAWSLSPTQSKGPIQDVDRDAAVRDLVGSKVMIPQLLQGTSDDDLISLDSVGGTILYIRANLIRQGLRFPHANAVGTTWGNSGWIGVETEGICYVAKGLQGGDCYVLGGRYHVRHTDWG